MVSSLPARNPISAPCTHALIKNQYSPRIAGELEVARANNVCLYVAQKIKAQSKKKKITPSKKRIGLLIITNFRLCFVAFDERSEDKSYSLKVRKEEGESVVLLKYAHCL
jgi:hypothetical protein